MPLYEFYCNGCENRFEKIIRTANIHPSGQVDPNVTCESCGAVNCTRLMTTGVRGWDGVQEPWEYDYTHKVKPKFIKDSHGHRERFDPSKHTQGRKGAGK